MPNPFVGMDPYLEGEMWTEFHSRIANAISEQLMPQLKPKYVALLHKYYAVDDTGVTITGTPAKESVYPDVHVTRVAETATALYTMGPAKPMVAPLELENPLPQSVPLLRVEVRDVAGRELVTVIEILSPANKYGRGAREYTRKRAALLNTNTHLMEIDLLRHGRRITLIGRPPPAAYFVYLSRSQRRPRVQVWPIGLRDPLPTAPVPLRVPDPDASLDLQAALTACYDLVGYEQLLNYREPLQGLSEDDANWVESCLRSAHLKG